MTGLTRLFPYILLFGGVIATLLSRKKKKKLSSRPNLQTIPSKVNLPNDMNSLLETLNHPDWRIREAAVWALAENFNPIIIPHLIGLLDDTDNDVREAASNVLIAFGDDSVPYLLDVVSSDRSVIARENAVKALSIIADHTAVPSLIDALNDPSVWVRIPVAQALGNIGDAQAVPALINALKDTDLDMRKTAIEALEQIGTPEALAALTEDI